MTTLVLAVGVQRRSASPQNRNGSEWARDLHSLQLFVRMAVASVVVSLWVGSLDKRGQTAAGDRIDRRCRWIFPVLYGGLLLIVVGVTLFVVG